MNQVSVQPMGSPPVATVEEVSHFAQNWDQAVGFMGFPRVASLSLLLITVEPAPSHPDGCLLVVPVASSDMSPCTQTSRALGSAFVALQPASTWRVPRKPNIARTAAPGITMSSLSPRPLDTSAVIEPTSGVHDSTIVFLHGSGDSGAGARDWVSGVTGGEFAFPTTRVIFPTAPMRRYSLLGPHGMQRVWFDRKQLGPMGAEDVDGADEMRAQVRLVIDQEVAEGIPLNRIVVGGFSMGAAQSLHMLSDAELSQNLAGVFAMSTFLAEDSVLPSRLAAQIENGGRVPPLLYWHGTADAMIKLEWAEASVPRLQGAKVDVSWRTWPGLGHDMRSDELAALHQWLTGILE